jgi:hypothetical protein
MVFQKRVVRVGVDVVDTLSSDAARQGFIDAMATLVKLSEALHTPETKALLEQMSVLGCRIVDAASVGRNKQLFHDFYEALWAGFELAADPSTTVALAEVTACLCYALEMEEAYHRRKDPSAKRAAKRRHELNRYQRQTYVDPDLTRDPDSTVEQVILSSLGGGIGPEADSSSVPSNIAWDHHDTGTTESERDTTGTADGDVKVPPEDLNDAAREAVDVKYLKKEIARRASNMERRHMMTTMVTTTVTHSPPEGQDLEKPTQERETCVPKDEQENEIEDIIVETVEDSDSDVDNSGVVMRRQPTPTTSNVVTKEPKRTIKYEDSLETPPVGDKDGDVAEKSKSSGTRVSETSVPVPAIDGEPAASRFYRSLDEFMTKKREETLDSDLLAVENGRIWHPRAAAASGAGNERGQDTIKMRMKALQASKRSAEIGVGKPRGRRESLTRKQIPPKLAILVFLLLFTWFGLGCYGLWAIIHPRIRGFSPVWKRGGLPQPVPVQTHSDTNKEIVIRIVKEVIHRSADGSIIETIGKTQVDVAEVDSHRVAECVAAAM